MGVVFKMSASLTVESNRFFDVTTQPHTDNWTYSVALLVLLLPVSTSSVDHSMLGVLVAYCLPPPPPLSLSFLSVCHLYQGQVARQAFVP